MKYLKSFKENFSWKRLTIDDVFDCIDFYDSYKDLYPGFSQDNTYSNEYMFDTKEKAYQYGNDILNIFNNLPPIVDIYRAVYIKNENEIDPEYPGDHWSFDKQSALDFARNQNRGNYLYTAKVRAEDIDYKNSIKNFIQFSQNHDGYDENELVVNGFNVFDFKYEKITKTPVADYIDYKIVNDNLKPLGIAIKKIAPFIPSTNKVKRGITANNRYTLRYNFMNTIFKKLFTAIYKEKFDISKLRWIYVLSGKDVGGSIFNVKSTIQFGTSPHISTEDLLEEILGRVVTGDYGISYDDIETITKASQIKADFFNQILTECICYIKQYLIRNGKVLSKEDIYKTIADVLSNSHNYSIISSVKNDRFLWKKLAPYIGSGANDAATMGESGFSD